VQIALAIAIIRSKPEGITAVQHAAIIQARFRAKYSNSVSFNNALFYYEQILTRHTQIVNSSSFILT
jgi:hypothetical protein